jgi:trehalose/maltose hydrolase-like predicted phosphorylase
MNRAREVSGARRDSAPNLLSATERTFEAVIFDWDGTAVSDRRADAAGVRQRVESLCSWGVHVFVVSGTHRANVDGQLAARPHGSGRLHLCVNRGSQVFEVGPGGPVIRMHRSAAAAEERALDDAARDVASALSRRGLRVRVISDRLNRRKVDLIPEPGWEDPPKARIDDLLAAVGERLRRAGIAALADVVREAEEAARGAGLSNPRVTSDGKHVEIGLTDKSDSARWAARWLSERGITGRLILISGDELGPVGAVPGSDSKLLVDELVRAVVVSVGVEPNGVPTGVIHSGGGPAQLLELLDIQLARRRNRRVPGIDDDPAWIVPLPGESSMRRAAESMGTLTNGWAGTRAALEEDGPGTLPSFTVGGIYVGDAAGSRLLSGPIWTACSVTGRLEREERAERAERAVDLRTGVMVRTTRDAPSLQTLRFVSLAHPEVLALRVEGTPADVDPGSSLAAPPDGIEMERQDRGSVRLARTNTGTGGGITVAAHDQEVTADGQRVIERLATWCAHPSRVPDWEEAVALLDNAQRSGFDRLLSDHRHAWARLWADARISIDGSPDDELAARFAMFHLLGAARDRDEAAVGARGLSGSAYGGHVFWDADVFVLPVLAAVRPASARAMLEYRIRRLPAARAAAIAGGRRGARFPWESAADGTDVTPRSATGRHGETIPIRTGDKEEHVVAAVAWAANDYTRWTGDRQFLAGPGRDLILETARYWSSRLRLGHDGRAHLYGVMGPDEYHEIVDDNAYTNVMARWNLRRAAELVDQLGGDREERDHWLTQAGSLVDGWDPDRGLYEQFAGYWKLEPLLVADLATPPVAADVLLGAERVAGSQIIKQADTVMLHHLVPDEVVAGSLAANLAFYEPRTAHGSSLSPAIHAALLARAGHVERALELFRIAARLDLDDLTGTTAGGVHMATMGGLWQALAYGFLGLRPGADALEADPRLPSSWAGLTLSFRFRGAPVTVRATHQAVTFTCVQPLPVRIAGRATATCEAPGGTYPLEGSTA